MNATVTIDWKFVVALGLIICGGIIAVKIGPEAAERVSIRAIDALKEYAAAVTLNR